MSDPATVEAISSAVLNRMRRDWHDARSFLQATQGWPDTDCNDVTAAIAAAVQAGDRDELLSWSVWLASKAAEARNSGFAKAMADEAHRAMVAAEAAITPAQWREIRRELAAKNGGEDKSRMTMRAR